MISTHNNAVRLFFAAQLVLAVTLLAGAMSAQTLAGYWTFDQGTGTTAADSSGNNHTATLYNGVSWVPGQMGDAVSANAAENQYVRIPAVDMSTTKAVTVTLWSNRTYSAAGGHVLFEASTDYEKSVGGFIFLPDDATCQGIQVGLRGNVGYTANCYSQPSSGVWHHLAVVLDKTQSAGNAVALYVDGVLQNPTRSLNTSTNTNDFAMLPIYLFSQDGTTQFDSGAVDDVRLYIGALTATQITQVYHSSQSQLTKDVVASVDGSDVMTTPSFTTSSNGDLLLAFVAYDGPSNSLQTATVTGGGLTWGLVKRSNGQAGTSEVWAATAPNAPFTATVSSAPGSTGNYHGSLTVIGFSNASSTVVAGQAGATSGAPDVTLAGLAAGNWVFAVGNDWDNAIARTPITGQVLVHQRVDTTVNDTYWVQSTVAPLAATGTVDIHDSAPTTDRWNYAAVAIVAKSGTVQGFLSPSPTAVAFGSLNTGTSASKTITLTNTGSVPVKVSSVTASGTGFSVSGATTPFTLASGQSTTITATFAPTAVGAVSGGVTVTSNASNGSLSLPLTGTGASAVPGTLTPSPTSLAFGSINVSSSTSKTVSIANTGGAAVTVSAISVSGAGFSFSGVTTPFSLASGQSATITATFAPTSSGAVSGTIKVTSNASNGSLSVPLTGTGVSNPSDWVSLGWTASTSPVSGYNVYRSGTSGGPYTKLNSSLITVTSYSDMAVQSGYTYYYVSTSVDSQGVESAYSNQAVATAP